MCDYTLRAESILLFNLSIMQLAKRLSCQSCGWLKSGRRAADSLDGRASPDRRRVNKGAQESGILCMTLLETRH